MKLFHQFMIVLIIISYYGIVHCEKTNNNDYALPRKHNIGFAAGHATGIGLSYRKWNNLYGYQITFTPIITEYKTDLYIGTLGLRTIYNKGPSHLYLYYGGHINFQYSDNLDNYKKESNINIGIGPGLEFELLGLSFNIMAGFTSMYSFANKFRLQPTVEGGIYYSFDSSIEK